MSSILTDQILMSILNNMQKLSKMLSNVLSNFFNYLDLILYGLEVTKERELLSSINKNWINLLKHTKRD